MTQNSARKIYVSLRHCGNKYAPGGTCVCESSLCGVLARWQKHTKPLILVVVRPAPPSPPDENNIHPWMCHKHRKLVHIEKRNGIVIFSPGPSMLTKPKFECIEWILNAASSSRTRHSTAAAMKSFLFFVWYKRRDEKFSSTRSSSLTPWKSSKFNFDVACLLK